MLVSLENVHPDAFTSFWAGFTVETVTSSLSEEELIKKIKGVHVLGISL